MDFLHLSIIFFDLKTSGGAVKNEIIQNKELAEKLNKPSIRKFEKRKLHSFLQITFGVLILLICN